MKYSSKQSGFTLIEMLVSLSLFTIVMTITLGTLLILIKGNQVSVAEQSVMDTLAFSLDSMTREIRTGSYYVCVSANGPNQPAESTSYIPSSPAVLNRYFFHDTNTEPFSASRNQHHNNLNTSYGLKSRDCVAGNSGNNRLHGLSFVEGGNSITGGSAGRILYYFDSNTGTIMRRVRSNAAEPIISNSIEIVNAEFFVSGAARLNYSDAVQPSVTIVIQARERGNTEAEIVTLQTTITQQSLDL